MFVKPGQVVFEYRFKVKPYISLCLRRTYKSLFDVCNYYKIYKQKLYLMFVIQNKISKQP